MTAGIHDVMVDHGTRPLAEYEAFLRAKVPTTAGQGVSVPDSAFSPKLKPHQRAIARWMVEGGRRACFAAFGLGKTMIQLEACRVARERQGGHALITIPLGVRQEFVRDAAFLGIPVRFIRRWEDVDDEATIYLTNYETVRDGKLDPRRFTVTSLDEASVLRGFGGTKTFREFMRLFADDDGGTGQIGGGIPFRFVATATPSPNEYIELLAYAAYLGVMDVGNAKTRFFKRNSEKADQLTIRPHKEEEFWLWVASWAVFCTKPSDLGPEYSDEGYVLPPMEVHWHELPTDHTRAGTRRDGQARMFRDTALGVVDASREKRDSLDARVEKLATLIEWDRQFLVWVDLNDEQRAVEWLLDDLCVPYSSIDGSQELDERDALLEAWRRRETIGFVSKPVMYGAGVNLQQCSRAVFLGIGFKFAEFAQAIHRIHRFGQTETVKIDLIYTEAERAVRDTLEQKWRQHEAMVGKMTDLIRRHGLARISTAAAAARTLGTKRVVAEGPGYRIANDDAILDARSIESDTVGLVLTSIPFSTQYEYSPSYHDLGHTDDDAHFFEHLGWLTPELHRILKPGRVACIHVKDRIVPSGISGLGFQTVSPFSDKTIAHFQQHGFGLLARVTIVTDVVRENNQTYRLGWTEQSKDGSKMGNGMPEYLLVFRKPPTDRSNGYADEPVRKSKEEYTRARWQIDAHGFWRSSGNRLLTPSDLIHLPHEKIFKLWREFGLANVYDYEQHVALCQALEDAERLPTTFMLFQPPSAHPDVWTDVARMRTLNAQQEKKGQDQHLCPLQEDTAKRCIVRYSELGDIVYDPFLGIGSVAYYAIQLARVGWGSELSPAYFADARGYVEAAAQQRSMPSLFDLVEAEREPAA